MADFLGVISAFELIHDTVERLNESGAIAALPSARLQRLLSRCGEGQGRLPDLDKALRPVVASFSREEAASQGEPRTGLRGVGQVD